MAHLPPGVIPGPVTTRLVPIATGSAPQPSQFRTRVRPRMQFTGHAPSITVPPPKPPTLVHLPSPSTQIPPQQPEMVQWKRQHKKVLCLTKQDLQNLSIPNTNNTVTIKTVDGTVVLPEQQNILEDLNGHTHK